MTATAWYGSVIIKMNLKKIPEKKSMNNNKILSLLLAVYASLSSFFCVFSDAPFKVTLITVLYNEMHEQRKNEFITCFERNKQHPAIEHIHVVYDTSKDTAAHSEILDYLKQQECTISYVIGRPTYGYCFDLANGQYPNARIILSNADIYFNDTLNKLEGYDLNNKFLAITRWNVLDDGRLEIFKQFKADGSFDEPMSQLSMDAWIFKTPLKTFINPEFQLGTWACDGYIAYQAYISGLDVINPCLSIQCCHLHLSKIRHWIPQSIPGAKALRVPWGTL